MGTYTTAFDLGIGSGAMLCGLLIDAFDFHVMYLLSGAVCLLALAVLAAGGGFGQRAGKIHKENVAVIRDN